MLLVCDCCALLRRGYLYKRKWSYFRIKRGHRQPPRIQHRHFKTSFHGATWLLYISTTVVLETCIGFEDGGASNNPTCPFGHFSHHLPAAVSYNPMPALQLHRMVSVYLNEWIYIYVFIVMSEWVVGCEYLIYLKINQETVLYFSSSQKFLYKESPHCSQ